MREHTIEIKDNKTTLEFPANWNDSFEAIVIPGEGDTPTYETPANRNEFTVVIDGQETGGGFRYEISEGYWFDTILFENTFTVVTKENFNLSERTGYITIHHNRIQGANGDVTVVVKQEGVQCKVEIKKEEENYSDNLSQELKSIFTDEDKIPQIFDLNVNAIGGNGKYFIKSFRKYYDDKVITNDNGVKIQKVDNTLFRITNYGRSSVTNDETYKIELAHDNDESKVATIILTYDNVDVKSEVPVITTRERQTPTETNQSNTRSMKKTVKKQRREVQEPSFSIYGINAPVVTETKRGKKKEEEPSDEIVFPVEGGTQEFIFDIYPTNAILVVKLSSDFVTYKIKGNKLTLTAKNNFYMTERKCILTVYNSYNQFNIFVKTVRQLGAVEEIVEKEEEETKEEKKEALEK